MSVHIAVSSKRDGVLIRPGVRLRHGDSINQWLASVFPNAELRSIVSMNQVHGTRIARVRSKGFSIVPRADGLMTDVPGTVLLIKTADCVPIVLYDPIHHAVAVLHAGWRGTVKGIAGKAVHVLRKHFHSNPADLRAWLGPAIHACCYNCLSELVALFRIRFGPLVIKRNSAIDLIAANRMLLKGAGVTSHHIRADSRCTACAGHSRFFSYRRGDTSSFATAVRL